MTKAQKNELRWVLRNEPHKPDTLIARSVGCTLGTVKKYRKIFSPAQGQTP